METAMCLIEANQAVYPLDIVRQMRDQRAMLIQTPVRNMPNPNNNIGTPPPPLPPPSQRAMLIQTPVRNMPNP